MSQPSAPSSRRNIPGGASVSDVCKIKPAPGLLLLEVRLRAQQTAQAAAHLCHLLTSQLLVLSQCLISAGRCGTYLGEWTLQESVNVLICPMACSWCCRFGGGLALWLEDQGSPAVKRMTLWGFGGDVNNRPFWRFTGAAGGIPGGHGRARAARGAVASGAARGRGLPTPRGGL